MSKKGVLDKRKESRGEGKRQKNVKCEESSL
jgi:hypothetical protein